MVCIAHCHTTEHTSLTVTSQNTHHSLSTLKMSTAVVKFSEVAMTPDGGDTVMMTSKLSTGSRIPSTMVGMGIVMELVPLGKVWTTFVMGT